MVDAIGGASSVRGISLESKMRMLALENSQSAIPLPSSGAIPLEGVPKDRSREVHDKFQDFMAGTFYSEMVKAMRSGTGKAAYFHGGQAEEIFQGQLDQIVSANLAKTHGASFAEPMFRAYQEQRGIAPPAGSHLDATA